MSITVTPCVTPLVTEPRNGAVMQQRREEEIRGEAVVRKLSEPRVCVSFPAATRGRA